MKLTVRNVDTKGRLKTCFDAAKKLIDIPAVSGGDNLDEGESAQLGVELCQAAAEISG